MKKTLALLICLMLVGAMAFASGDSEGSDGAKKIKANIASVYPPDSPVDKALNMFRDTVAEKSNGRIEILIHPASAMGSEVQTIEMIADGSVEIAAIGGTDAYMYFPKVATVEQPFMIASVDEFWKYWNGEPGQKMLKSLQEEHGIRAEGIIYRGARYLTSNTPVRTIEDLKGLKMRLPSVAPWIKVWEGLGAFPSTIDFGEVYLALKTGVIEAQENPAETILNYKFYEVQKYLIATQHVYTTGKVVTSDKWWNTLSAEDQALLDEAFAEAIAYGNELTAAGDAAFVAELQDLGMELITVDNEAFKKAAAPIQDEIAHQMWDYDTYLDLVEAMK